MGDHELVGEEDDEDEGVFELLLLSRSSKLAIMSSRAMG
jgi:hypothetical protein